MIQVVLLLLMLLFNMLYFYFSLHRLVFKSQEYTENLAPELHRCIKNTVEYM